MPMIHIAPGVGIPARFANRHTVITGPAGMGKTVTMMKLMESFADRGAAVIAPDMKGDLMALTRSCNVSVLQPLTGPGVAMRLEMWRLGADLMARALELPDAQAGAVEIAFAFAKERDYYLNTLKDFRNLLALMAADPQQVAHLGYVTPASIGTVQRALLRIETQGFGDLFGSPDYDIADSVPDGKVSIIDVSRLIHSPALYGAMMLYLLREYATRLRECGDLPRPNVAIVIDQAHSLFDGATPALMRSVDATLRQMQSKGVALIFASQSARDIPTIVRSQCASTIEFAREFGVGHCRFTTLDRSGQTRPARMIRTSPPQARLGALTPDEVAALPVTARGSDQPAPVAPSLAMTPQDWRFLRLGITCVAIAHFVIYAAGGAWYLHALPWIAFAQLDNLLARLAQPPDNPRR
ncbi:helicase HerA-like domain-containing protein [Paracoccus sp. (in: a-proteobacteria)]|uniref:helicase HerA-like domain-containing protein n=1 Tax=Paracoccus sp. TaxID=267 RepID=UPI0026DF9E81|nr:helicase HerA-like domain-containing protein [Paracoccus sp. (in: a-proteobacteria)]MDO5647024.1 DUF853 family protein [Paracoccus sp. (in: a-proteobacteria)]